MPKNIIAGSSGRFISNFLRNLQTDVQSGCTSLQSHQQQRSVPLLPHALQHVLLPVVLILAILIGVRQNLKVVLIFISLIVKDFEHFFEYYSAMWDSSVLNSWFSSILQFLVGVFGVLVMIFVSSLHILDISPQIGCGVS